MGGALRVLASPAVAAWRAGTWLLRGGGGRDEREEAVMAVGAEGLVGEPVFKGVGRHEQEVAAIAAICRLG